MRESFISGEIRVGGNEGGERSGSTRVALGLAGGGVAALALGRLVAGFLPSVGAADPLAFGAAALSLALVSWVAAFVPARRATRALPMELLRTE